MAFRNGPAGRTLGFYEIDLAKRIELPDIGKLAPPVEIQTAPPYHAEMPPIGRLMAFQLKQYIRVRQLVSEAVSHEVAARFNDSNRQIKRVEWTNQGWEITILAGEDEFTFLRKENGDSRRDWQLVVDH